MMVQLVAELRDRRDAHRFRVSVNRLLRANHYIVFKGSIAVSLAIATQVLWPVFS